MGGLLTALNAGRTSLRTNQKAIEITGNNIANVNTPGYSRQTPGLQPIPTLEMNGFFIGQGVTIDTVVREHDIFLTRQIIDKNATVGEESAKSAPLAELERIFNVSENSLAGEIDKFFDAWAELAANPNGQTERQIVLQRGELLSSSFQQAVINMEGVQKNINTSIDAKITGLNPKLQELADLNLRISTLERAGMPANSDRDRRDLILEEVSKTIGATYFEEDGIVSVKLPGGLPLVQDTTAMELESYYDNKGNFQLRLNTGDNTFDLEFDHLGGEFKGLIGIRDQFISDRMDDLDHLAYSLATAVNTAHQAGTQKGGGAGEPFFGPLPLEEGGFARSMEVNLTDPNQVAAGLGAAPGDNRNTLTIAALGKSLTVVDGGDSFTSYFAKMSARVGIEANRSDLTLGGLEDALVQIRNMRDATVGVSLEEEMINLMQYQKGFEASAKFLTTINEMMDSLLALKR